jgi:hypothetical protein
MKITNKSCLPEALVKAVSNDPYVKADDDISTTQLIDSPQIRALKRENSEEIEEDVSDRIWALLGQSIHTILERANLTGQVEQRLFATFDEIVVSGQFDHLENEILSDYKLTSVWAVIYGKVEWEYQLNVLTALCRANGLIVSKLQVVAILRDWQRSKAGKDGYPELQVVTIPITLWTEEHAQNYIKQRLDLHFNDNTFKCTDEERWYRGEKWAVMKKGRKTALRLLDTEEEAKEWCLFNGNAKETDYGFAIASNITIEHRPGIYNRCENYCSVNRWCHQYQNGRSD